MKIVLTPTVDEISDLLYSSDLVIKSIEEKKGKVEIRVDGIQFKTLYELLRGTYRIAKIESWETQTLCRIKQKRKLKWF